MGGTRWSGRGKGEGGHLVFGALVFCTLATGKLSFPLYPPKKFLFCGWGQR